MSQPGLETQAEDPFGLLGREIEPGIVAERVVGSGGFGTVYQGRHASFRANVAIKVLRIPPHIPEHGKQHLKRKFEYEAQILSWLAGLTLNVPRPLSAKFWTAPNGLIAPYIVQEWLEGMALDTFIEQARIAEPRYLSFEQVFDLLDPVVETLRFAHARVVHRDLKPSNIFLAHVEGQNRTKLLDFGISKIVGEGLASAGVSSVTGHDLKAFTPAYAAPEQWDPSLGEPSAQTDIFSFALVLLELLTLQPALAGATPQQLMFSCTQAAQRSTPRKLGLRVPDATEALFGRALAYQPSLRPRSIDAWWIAVKESLGTDSIDGGTLQQELAGAHASTNTAAPSKPIAPDALPGQLLEQRNLGSTQPLPAPGKREVAEMAGGQQTAEAAEAKPPAAAAAQSALDDEVAGSRAEPPNFDDRTRIGSLASLLTGEVHQGPLIASAKPSTPLRRKRRSRRRSLVAVGLGVLLALSIALGVRGLLLQDPPASPEAGAPDGQQQVRPTSAPARLNATVPERSRAQGTTD